MAAALDQSICLELGTGAPDLRAAIRAGFPSGVLTHVLHASGLTLTEVASSLDLSLRSLQRRGRQQRLTPQESDRVYRLARVLALAKALIGDEESARRWLKQANEALGGETPLAALDTELGARRVEDVLGRIAYGGVS
jgi:putative toxin-antitoxin system antitoxin component (TIGR02293 family)